MTSQLPQRHRWLPSAKQLTRKHCYAVNIAKVSISLTVKRSPQVGNKDLGALEKAYGALLELRFVAEALKVFGQGVYEAYGGVVGLLDQRWDAVVEALGNVVLADVTITSSVEEILNSRDIPFQEQHPLHAGSGAVLLTVASSRPRQI